MPFNSRLTAFLSFDTLKQGRAGTYTVKQQSDGTVMDEEPESARGTGGYTIAYSQDEAPFPVYVAATLSAILFTAAVYQWNWIFLSLGVLLAAFTYYNFPLIEKGRPRMGANQYGIFIEGFGILGWRAIDKISLIQIAVRAETRNELQITLRQPLTKALIADWRTMPLYRRYMRLPWSMSYNNMIRITLDPFDKEPDEIHRTLERMWRYYRS